MIFKLSADVEVCKAGHACVRVVSAGVLLLLLLLLLL